jgi:hypothetical protein
MSNQNNSKTFDSIISDISQKISDIEKNGEKNYSITDTEVLIEENKKLFTNRGQPMRLNALQKRLQQLTANKPNNIPNEKDEENEQQRLRELRLVNEEKKDNELKRREKEVMNAAVYNTDIDLKQYPNFEHFMKLEERPREGGKKKSRRRHTLKKRKSTKIRKSNSK